MGREVRPYEPDDSPLACCRNCQKMLEGVENRCLTHFEAKFRKQIGHIADCKPTVTPAGTQCSSPCSFNVVVDDDPTTTAVDPMM